MDAAALSTPDRVSRDMLVRELTHEIAGYEFGTYRIPLNADSGFHTDFADIPNRNAVPRTPRTTRATSPG